MKTVYKDWGRISDIALSFSLPSIKGYFVWAISSAAFLEEFISTHTNLFQDSIKEGSAYIFIRVYGYNSSSTVRMAVITMTTFLTYGLEALFFEKFADFFRREKREFHRLDDFDFLYADKLHRFFLGLDFQAQLDSFPDVFHQLIKAGALAETALKLWNPADVHSVFVLFNNHMEYPSHR